MKKQIITLLALIPLIIHAQENTGIEAPSRIHEVKLFQNKAIITRKASVTLKSGSNEVVFTGLPKTLYNWSARGTVSKSFKGKIISMEVEKKALSGKGQKRIVALENQLEELREQDRVYLDRLKAINEQITFLSSITSFTTQTASKELATRIPQVSVWEKTITYTARKQALLLSKKRVIEKKRKKLGKEIQKLQFNLRQVAGYRYYKNYLRLNKIMQKNQSSMQVQQFARSNSNYALRDKYLRKGGEKVEVEKRINMNIYARTPGRTDIAISYIIPYTKWKMQYDFRADKKQNTVKMTVYGSIYQNTGEDWKNVRLSLSTGAPVNSISPPELNPWYLDISTSDRIRNDSKRKYSPYRKRSKGVAGAGVYAKKAEKRIQYQTKVSEKGSSFEIELPVKQTILSSSKYQKKYIKDFSITEKSGADFFYTLSPAVSTKSFLKVKTTNKTALPWLQGDAQIFLNNQFMGKTTIPYTPNGKNETIVLGNESRITGKKVLVKKFEDTSGIFGSERRIAYTYKITVENQMPQATSVVLYDRVPVSRNKKIEVEIKDMSINYISNEKEKKSPEFQKGIRKWKLTMKPNSSRSITYTVVISFDKKISISGLK